MTFSLGFEEITPLDVWGKRVLTDYYRIDSRLKYKEMRSWYSNYFKENTAIAGQYLFEYIRNNYKN
jgi:3-methyladenine DNA glycosylase/8-oxoguanine DNA glycosylase